MLTRSGRCAVLAFVVAAAFVGTGSALGDSSTIAGEPLVKPDHQQFGNSSGDPTPGDEATSYWGLPVIAGDRVSIAWEADHPTALYAEPVGTKGQLGIVALASNAVAARNATRHSVLRFIAPRTGVMPLAFNAGSLDLGPYDFTATVLHQADVQLPGVHAITRRGVLTLGAHDPDGRPLTDRKLRIRLQREVSPGHWTPIGQASPRHGHVHIRYALPKRLLGQVVHIRAEASGGGYYKRVTVSRTVRIR